MMTISPFAFQDRIAPSGAKICGIRTIADYQHCREQGAAFVGCVFFEKSPRHLTWQEAQAIANVASEDGPVRVALCVNADDAYLDNIMAYASPDMLQLHGDETPARAHAIRQRYQIPVMKAFRVASKADITTSESYYDAVDWLLFDAASANPDLPGGTGHQFDWSLVSDLAPPLPWMLAGGLTAQTLASAKTQTPARYFDVSSAIERAKGIKDHDLITNFIDAAK